MCVFIEPIRTRFAPINLYLWLSIKNIKKSNQLIHWVLIPQTKKEDSFVCWETYIVATSHLEA